MRSRTNPYLMLRPARGVADAPKELLPYLATVRRADEWKRLGFEVILSQIGYPRRSDTQPYEFSLARETDDLISDAIKSGKKAVRHPLIVLDYVRAGCSVADFANLPEDVAEYCAGMMLQTEGKLERALDHLHNAVTLNPQQVRYFEAYFPLRLQLGDLSAISDEIEYYSSDMDSALHAGRFDEWMRALINAKQYEPAKIVMSATETALRDLVEGRAEAKLYGTQKESWYQYKLGQFLKKAEKYNARIDKKVKRMTQSPESQGTKPDVPLQAAEVIQVIYNFTQRCFVGEKKGKAVDLSHEESLFARLAAGSINQIEAHQLPTGQRHVFRELLTQYIMFLEMNKQLNFPPDFLIGSSKDELGGNVLEYICRHRWPFPQMLAR